LLGEGSSSGVEAVVGREVELEAIESVCRPPPDGRSVLLVGEPGIGKTALWEAGVRRAAARGLRVLAARPRDSEARMPFSSLIDLCERIDLGGLARVPPPQRSALEVALLRREPGPETGEEMGIALGFLNMVRALATSARVLIAIDDVQWLDRSSSEVVAFAARRLGEANVGFLLSRRRDEAAELDRALGARLELVQVGPLSLGSVRRLLFERLELTLSRRQLRRLVEVTGGNPLFALEAGRLLLERTVPATGEDIPLPDALEQAVGDRVAALPDGVRRLLLAVALHEDPLVDELAALAEPAGLEDAVDLGVLVIDGDRVRAAHPLLAAAAWKAARAAERRAQHRALAGVVSDEQLRVMHLALATTRRDPTLAERVFAAADQASARGARGYAVQLARHGLRLTPPTADEREERVLALAGYLYDAGELQQLRDLLTSELASLTAGALRARAHLLIGEASNLDDHERHLQEALAECDDPALRAAALGRRSILLSLVRVQRLEHAEALAQEAFAQAGFAGPQLERETVPALAWARVLRGQPVEGLVDLLGGPPEDGDLYLGTIDRPAAVRFAFRGEIAAARREFARLLALAERRGEARSCAVLHLHRFEVEQRTGAVAIAAGLLEEWGDWTALENPERAGVLRDRCLALLAAIRGAPSETQRWAEVVLQASETSAEHTWDRLEALRGLGIAMLLDHAPDQAAEFLEAVWEHTRRERVEEPGAFPVAGDLVEALVETEAVAKARAVTARLRKLASAQAHSWGLATAERCAAMIRLASAYDEQDAASLARAAERYGALGLEFERCRTLLFLGRLQRRVRRRAAARRSLEASADGFERLGCGGWAERARAEAGRIAARRSSASGELTPAERRVVELAAEGLANKEIARVLYVTVNTVEVHLARAYAKLGVRSRAQLAKRLSATS
jgi:DNA-binding CsgD family transcriptional regulator/predicted ATPase